MANVIEVANWEEGIYQIEMTDDALGGDGEDAIANRQAKQLANRTVWLKDLLLLRAALESPEFTGTPKVPTAAAGTNTTQAASTAFVRAAITALIDSSPGALDTLNELAAALGDDPNFATTVTNALALKSPLASPVFTGNPQAPTPAPGDNDTSIATTSFVNTAISALSTVPDASTLVKGIIQIATDAEVLAGANTSKAVTPNSLQKNKRVLLAEVATTSGTEWIFNGIPAWATEIYVALKNFSLSTNVDILVQLGTAAGFEITGYTSSTGYTSAGGGNGANNTTGFIIWAASAAYTNSGEMHLSLVNSAINSWVETHTISYSSSSACGAGWKNLAAALTQVKITSVGGGGLGDAGSIAVYYK